MSEEMKKGIRKERKQGNKNREGKIKINRGGK
jgi:hypothetical protein